MSNPHTNMFIKENPMHNSQHMYTYTKIHFNANTSPSLFNVIFIIAEGMWSTHDLDTITDFFYDQVHDFCYSSSTSFHYKFLVLPQVSCPPYSVNTMTSFMRLLTLPLLLMKSCVQIMNLHLVWACSFFLFNHPILSVHPSVFCFAIAPSR